jgi:DNA-binding NtrC family response regulator
VNAPTLLIIDDEPQLRNMLERLLAGEGYVVRTAPTGAQALQRLKAETYQAVLCDVRLPDANGVELTRAIKLQQPDAEVIVLTAFGTIADAVQAMRNGAFQYLVKGDDNAKLIPTVAAAVLQSQQHRRKPAPSTTDPFAGITGRSPAITQAVALARKVAPTEATVLLLGATGTGKEVFAQAIHAASARSAKPLVAVNCSTFGSELLESELFGHVAGAFTGATKDKKGLLEVAKGGTLFLDEVGELPAPLQAKLLRVLETGDYLRVGDTVPQRADVRIMAATHRDLQYEAREGRFRQDLYYRLAVFTLPIPGLAERRADIPLLAEVFLERFAARLGKPITGMAPEVKEKLMAYGWPGHVRELRNAIERACILCEGTVLDVASLPLELQGEPARKLGAIHELETVEREHIRRVLAHTGGNKTLAAELLGIGLTTLYAKLKKWGE